jgi:hypothetical protein
LAADLQIKSFFVVGQGAERVFIVKAEQDEQLVHADGRGAPPPHTHQQDELQRRQNLTRQATQVR